MVDFKYLREQIIIALFSDDDLFDKLVLKGGNALALIHAIDDRASVDLDFSIEGSFPDEFNAEKKIKSTLTKHFDTIGYKVFGVKFIEKPHTPSEDAPWWGGYVVELKIVESEKYGKLYEEANEKGIDHHQYISTRAIALGGQDGKIKYKIDISRNEDCSRKEQATLDDITINVYSLEMIVIEKFRAICQQMPDYKYTHSRPRPRDFYDICKVLESRDIDLTNSQSEFESVFKIKDVPIEWLWEIPKFKDYHETDWQSVIDTTRGAESYEYYFDGVCRVLKKLEIAWNE